MPDGVFDAIDPRRVPLPNGTRVSTRSERVVGDRVVPQGAVGQVVETRGERIDVRLTDGEVVTYLRADLIPTKLGQMRYAVRREAAWSALRGCVVIETMVGSRAWGLSDADSDIDRRGVFVLPFGWTIGLSEPPRELVSADGSDTYWEIDKAILQALRADPNTLETLFLPSARACDPLGQMLLDVRDAFLSREIYGSFGRYALSQLKKLRGALRLAEHRHAIVSWLRDDPHTTLDRVAERLAREAAIEAPSERDRILRAKQYIKQLYGSLHDRGLLPARSFEELIRFSRAADADLELPRQLRPKNAYNLIRLIANATEWLATGSVHFEARGELRDRLLRIKRGEISLDEVVAQAEAMMPALDEARLESKLAAEPDVQRVDGALRAIREEAARRHFAREPGPFGADAPPMPRLERC